jgi:amidophosphoribosyltransferase
MLNDGGRDECGVFAVYAPGEDVAKLCFYGLYALQHRGQESAGIAVSDGRNILVTKEMGLVSQAFNEPRLAGMEGHLGIGHVRYSTTGGSTWENAQPAFRPTADGGLALAHNGNLVNTADLARLLGPAGAKCATDSALLAELLAQGEGNVEDTLALACAQARGAYSLVVMDERRIYAARDPHGVRPMVLGMLGDTGWVIASETVALDIVGATYVRDVEPGELVSIDDHGLRSRRFASPDPHFCLFEFVYIARPDSRLYGRNVHFARQRMGELLAEQAPLPPDPQDRPAMVMPVPESGVPAAQGFARASGIPYGDGLVKNRYIGRTFIAPSQELRSLGVRMKLNPLRENIDGKRLVVVEDSIVRGTTQRNVTRMLREAGAAEVHLRVTSPPYRWPCYYGVDTGDRSELLAASLTVEEIRDYLGVDSLAYLTLDRLVAATGAPGAGFCNACLTGDYPVPVPVSLRKSVLEGNDMPPTEPDSGLQAAHLTPGG